MIADRALQALALGALEPEWEARFEPKSYGFRTGRGCHDAIVAIRTTASRRDAGRLWVLDADLVAAFARLSHDHILASLGTFPAQGLVHRWLKAGVMEDGRFAPTKEGTPQGGLCSAEHNPPYAQFLLSIPLLRGRWKPSAAKRDEQEHESWSKPNWPSSTVEPRSARQPRTKPDVVPAPGTASGLNRQPVEQEDQRQCRGTVLSNSTSGNRM